MKKTCDSNTLTVPFARATSIDAVDGRLSGGPWSSSFVSSLPT
jgi:hypothetical protein